MAQVNANLSTGLPGLDRVLRGLIPGDNVVWQVESIEDYLPFVEPYAAVAEKLGQRLIYLRFARHEPLLGADSGAQIHDLDVTAGFESFVTQVHKVIREHGPGGYYVFDCLSDLADEWYSDPMLGNFFRLTCPYLFDMQAIAYFGLRRNQHSSHATDAIGNTCQVLLNVYRRDGRVYVHPLKVLQRHSPTMYMLHAREEDAFEPVTESSTISTILSTVSWFQLDASRREFGMWHESFLKGEQTLRAVQRGECSPVEADEILRRLIRMCITREGRMLDLIEKYFTLPDVLNIGKRIIGTGLVGGKSVGMLLARAILCHTDKRWVQRLEPHDSFFIGSDVFYTFLVRNGIWRDRERQRDTDTVLDGADNARRRMIIGTFPEYIVAQIEEMLDYFGQSPIIVRSSSLLEDSFGNAFSGKYESVFCANQGSREKRLEDFLSAVRTIYASTMSAKALTYRAQRGLLQQDEQMALLVMRVSGRLHDKFFYPHVAGVGFSHNPYVWTEGIDPAAGMLRLVFGLGTRAVDRRDDDYTRVVALSDPTLRPEGGFDEARQYAQRNVDVLDLEANQLVSKPLREVVEHGPKLPIEMFASRDEAMEARAAERGLKDVFPYVMAFDGLFKKTPFVEDMRTMLRTLHEAYDYPVDVEFTGNLLKGEDLRVNIVQCRPLQVKGGGAIGPEPESVAEGDVVFRVAGPVIGRSREGAVRRLIYVAPEVYGNLAIPDRYEIARLIGRLVHADRAAGEGELMLLGPGRWGTTTPSLGVPVAFSEIDQVTALCEIVAMREDVIPDVSLGTHFFNDLVESDICYLALFPNREGNTLNAAFFETLPNRLLDLVPEAGKWVDALRVVDPGGRVWLYANSTDQRALGYVRAES